MRRRAAALLLPLALLAGCGNSAADPEATTSSAAGDAGELPSVTGAFGEEPVIEIPEGDPGDTLQVEVLEEGDGAVVATGDVVVANYLGQRWDGPEDEAEASEDPSAAPPAPDDGGQDAVFDSTFDEGGSPIVFPLTEGALLQGMLDGLEGQAVGSRVLVVIPPSAGFGDTGSPDLGVGGTDSLIFIFDVLDAFNGESAAEGTPLEQPADPALPTVADGETGPTITVPSASTAPTELVVQTLIEGAGEEVVTGQDLVVQYRGVLWKDGSEFDASWTNGQPFNTQIGVGAVISGWDTGLVGQTVGSRVLLVIPPAEGYGEEGSPPTIAGDDTLVFVIDILGAYGEPA